MMLFGMINWTHTWYRPDGPIGPEQLADLAADLFLHGLCPSACDEQEKSWTWGSTARPRSSPAPAPASAAASRWRWPPKACGSAVVAAGGQLLETLAAEIVAAGGTPPVADRAGPPARGGAAGDRRGGARRPRLASTSWSTTPAAAGRFKLDASEEQWHEAITLNFTRPRQLTLALLDQMIARNWGRIINITGKSEPEGINGAFCAKAAMHSLGQGPLARGRPARHHRQLHPARAHP